MVYITGDIHGDFSRFTGKAAKKIKKGDVLFILGDFGFFWDGGKAEQKNLAKLKKLPYSIIFLDGVHENYEMLDALPREQHFGGQMRRVSDRIYHAQRGEIYTVENETYFTFGGGQPPGFLEHKTSRMRAVQSEDDIKNANSNLRRHGNNVDYILTHEPSGKIGGFVNNHQYNNAFLTSIEEVVQYKNWYFGSMHTDKLISRRHMSVFQCVLPVRQIVKKRRKSNNKKSDT